MNIPAMPEFNVIQILWVVIFVGSIVFALMYDARVRADEPGLKPYRWGYFLGMMGLVAGMTIIMQLVALPNARGAPTVFAIYTGVLFLGVITAFPAILRKRRWGWVLVSLFFVLVSRISLFNGFQPADLSLIFMAAFNIGYTIIRWKELGRLAKAAGGAVS